MTQKRPHKGTHDPQSPSKRPKLSQTRQQTIKSQAIATAGQSPPAIDILAWVEKFQIFLNGEQPIMPSANISPRDERVQSLGLDGDPRSPGASSSLFLNPRSTPSTNSLQKPQSHSSPQATLGNGPLRQNIKQPASTVLEKAIPMLNIHKKMSVQLHDGPLICTLSDLGLAYLSQAPNITLGKPPAVLWKAWDDSEGQGECTSHLVVKGRKVAIKYWGDLFQQTGGSHWQQCKHRWGKLKRLMEEWQSQTPQQFMRKWVQVDGKLMSNTAILEALSSAGLKDGQKTKESLELFLGKEQYESLFSYKKDGKVVVMTDPSSILRRTKSLATSNPKVHQEILARLGSDVDSEFVSG
ncbi:hypothetical protein BKA70DRAFT_1236724 [Coprinopsis sp. MPI-PUGE-AT-0042]|nr:hypothetical protein BKA70DRAFT_1236724 [Coprinopsis sp. MPI-PUGE-AT-0042]